LEQVAPAPELGTANPFVPKRIHQICGSGTGEAVHSACFGCGLARLKLQAEAGAAADQPLAGA
jgi:hypothetical protein